MELSEIHTLMLSSQQVLLVGLWVRIPGCSMHSVGD